MERLFFIEKSFENNKEIAVYEREGRDILSFWGIKDENITSYSIFEGTSMVFRICFSELYESFLGPNKKLKLQTLVIPSSVRLIRTADLPLSLCDIINYSPHFVIENKTLFTKGKKELIRCYDFYNDDKYVIPNEVELIRRDAFHSCRFNRIVLGHSVCKIEGNPFMNMISSEVLNLESVSDFFYVDWEGGLYSTERELIAFVGEGEEYHVADGTKSIRDGAFSGTNVRRIWLPASIKGFNIDKYFPIDNILFIIPDELKYYYWDSHIVDEMTYRLNTKHVKYTGEF